MKTERTEMTGYEKKALVLGLHPHALAALQRKKVVPRDISEFTAADDILVHKLAQIFVDPEILRLQLLKKTIRRRGELVAMAADFHEYTRWERKALSLFTAMYRHAADEGLDGEEQVSNDYVEAYLSKRCGVRTGKKHPVVTARLLQIRKVAQMRATRMEKKKPNAQK